MLASWFKKHLPPQWKLMAKMRWHQGRWRLGTEDRIFLEDVILPWFTAREDVRTVLDVGVDWYTRSYPQIFRAQDYWTIDVDADKRRYAGKQHHTLSLTELTRVFRNRQFDLLLCNGVIGWGVNESKDASLALDQCAQVLRPGGWLVVGWNDIPDHRVPGWEKLTTAAFDPFVFPPVQADHYVTATPYRHRYDFFRRSLTAQVPAHSASVSRATGRQ